MNIEKVPHVEDKANRKQLDKQMKEINRSHDTLKDQQVSLESFIEKYMPLKV